MMCLLLGLAEFSPALRASETRRWPAPAKVSIKKIFLGLS